MRSEAALRHVLGRRGRSGVFQEDHELVTAKTGDEATLARQQAEALGDATQQHVAEAVAEVVVDDLEIIDVQRDQHDAAAVLCDVTYGAPQVIEGIAPIGQPAEWIMVGEIAQPSRARPHTVLKFVLMAGNALVGFLQLLCHLVEGLAQFIELARSAVGYPHRLPAARKLPGGADQAPDRARHGEHGQQRRQQRHTQSQIGQPADGELSGTRCVHRALGRFGYCATRRCGEGSVKPQRQLQAGFGEAAPQRFDRRVLVQDGLVQHLGAAEVLLDELEPGPAGRFAELLAVHCHGCAQAACRGAQGGVFRFRSGDQVVVEGRAYPAELEFEFRIRAARQGRVGKLYVDAVCRRDASGQLIERVAQAVQGGLALRAEVDQGPAEASMFLGLGPESGDLGRRTRLQRRIAVEGGQQRLFRFGDCRPTGDRRRPDLGQHGPVERGHAVGQRVGHP